MSINLASLQRAFDACEARCEGASDLVRRPNDQLIVLRANRRESWTIWASPAQVEGAEVPKEAAGPASDLFLRSSRKTSRSRYT